MINESDIKMAIDDIVENIVGDTPVSVQLNAALEQMARKDHTHDNYASQEEFNKLKKIVEQLVDLVGDAPVSAQIVSALKKG